MKVADLPELKGEVCLECKNFNYVSHLNIPQGLVKAGVQEAVNRQEVLN